MIRKLVKFVKQKIRNSRRKTVILKNYFLFSRKKETHKKKEKNKKKRKKKKLKRSSRRNCCRWIPGFRGAPAAPHSPETRGGRQRPSPPWGRASPRAPPPPGPPWAPCCPWPLNPPPPLGARLCRQGPRVLKIRCGNFWNLRKNKLWPIHLIIKMYFNREDKLYAIDPCESQFESQDIFSHFVRK